MQEDQFTSSFHQSGSQEDPIYEYARTQHLYAEGPDFLLSDIILYPHFYMVMNAKMKNLLPKSFAWYQRVSEKSLQSCESTIITGKSMKTLNLEFVWPKVEVPNHSLYKCDPKRLNPSARIFTRQPDIDRAMEAVSEAGIEVSLI